MRKTKNARPSIPSGSNTQGNKGTFQVVNAVRGIAKNVVQVAGDLAIHVPGWSFVLGTLALAISLIFAVGIANVPILRQLLPTPTAFAPADETQSLIIVADFDDRSVGEQPGMDPAQYIYEKLV
jgi:hypothetical protein